MSDIRFNRWLHQSGTGGVYQDSSGRVGIGTSVPTSALDVQSGSIKIGSNTLISSGVSTFTTVNATTVNTTSIVGVTTAGITTAYIGSINDGALSGARNRIINGAMDIWQRGTSTTATGTAYLADRWAYQFPTGGTVSQTATAPTGSRYAWNYTASASNSYLQMGQQIEYANCLDLQGQTVTISFVAKANNSNAGSTGLIVRTRTSASIDSAIYFSGTNVDSTVTLTTSYAKYSVTRTLPSSFGSLSLEFTIGSHISGDGFSISQVQLEPGTVATPFERRSYGQELALAQRYCHKWTAGGDGTNLYARFPMGIWGSSTQITVPFSHPVSMRTATKTVTSNVSALNVYNNGFTFSSGVTWSINTDACTFDTTFVNANGLSGGTGSTLAAARFINDSNAYILFTAEL